MKRRTQRKELQFPFLQFDTYSVEQSKVAFSFADDKRFILEDKITTLALGRYRITDLENT